LDADPPDRWVNFARRNTRPRYASEAQRAPRHAFDHMLNKPAARISRAEAVNTLDGLAKAGKAAMAGRTMAYARARFRWAEQRGKVPGNPFMNLPIPAGTVERERVLSDDELGRIWNAADVMPYPWGPLFRILLLTLGRREEVAAMRWSELSSELAGWTIPSARFPTSLHDVLPHGTRWPRFRASMARTWCSPPPAARRYQVSQRPRPRWTGPAVSRIGACVISAARASRHSRPWG